MSTGNQIVVRKIVEWHDSLTEKDKQRMSEKYGKCYNIEYVYTCEVLRNDEKVKSNVFENYRSRLSEVLEVTGQLKQADLDYCKELSKQEVAQHTGSNGFLEGLLKRILAGEHEIINNALRDSVVSKAHILKVFEDLAIYEKKNNF